MDKTIKIAVGLFMVVALACAIFFVIPSNRAALVGLEASVHLSSDC